MEKNNWYVLPWRVKFMKFLRFIKVTAFFIVFFTIQTFALSVYSQGTNVKNSMIENVLSQIEPQLKTIKGKVIDQSGQSLPGVTIAVKGTNQGIVTDYDGNYTLNNVSSNATLIFSFVGMKNQEIVVAGSSLINVTMEEQAIGVGEVVVTALGIKRQKKSIGYSTTKVGGNDMVESRDINLGNALSGKLRE